MKNTQKKRLPPFGKELEMFLSYGCKPKNDIFLFAGIAGLEKAKSFSNTQFALYLPYSDNPDKYHWPVHECPVLAIDTGFMNMSEIKNLAFCLLNSKAEIVRFILANYKLRIFRREAA